LYINSHAFDIFGYSEEELLGKSAFEFVHPDDKEYVKREYEKCKKLGIAVVEYRFRKKSGKYLWVESTGRFVTEGDNEYVLVISRDITSRKKAEEALIKSQQFYRTLIEKQGEGIIIADKNETITYCNEAAEKIFGTEKGGLVGTNLRDYMSEETYDFVVQQTQKRFRGEKSTYEIDVIRPSGEKRVILVSAAPWYDKNDNIIGAFGIIRDETERKKAENELAAEKERLHVTLLSIAEGVITTDMKGIVTSINKSAQKLLEWESKDALGKHIEEIYRYEQSDSGRYTFITKILDSKYQVLQQEEAIILSQTGEEIMISESIAPIKDQKSEIIGAVVVFRDIRDKKMLEVLEEKIRQAEKLQSLSLFAGGIAHDFNNMMTGIMCNIALAKLYVKPTEKAYSVLTEAEKGFSRAKDLTQQLMTFAKSGSPTKKLGSITEILKDTVKFTLSGSNVKSDFKIDENISPAEFDNGQMSQVFSNLTINAQQAMPDGGKLHVVAEDVYISDDKLLPLSEGKYVKISFIDEGVGISEENKRRIFDPYFTTKENGSGLGLANVFSIVEKHHGFIDVESEVDKGTQFSLYLPAKEGKPLRREESSSGSIRGNGRILLMDDEEVIRKTAGDLLHRIGFKVTLARNGKEAIELYEKEMNNSKSFDAVILDLTIPAGMGGLECLHALKQIDPNVKAIVSSGYSNDPIIANYKNHGFEGVIIKPYIIDEFYETISRVLGKN
jgi:PAS domain S-box-containing protein